MPDSSSMSLPAEAVPAANPYRRRTIATNFLAMSLVSGSLLLIGIFTTAYSRRALGPSAIGQVNWNAALLLFLTLLASPGIATIGQRDVAANHKRTASMASLVLGLQMVFALVAYGMVVAIALLDPRSGRSSTLLMVQGLAVLINAGNLAWVLQAHQRMAGPAIASLVLNLMQIPALLALVHEPSDVVVFAALTLPFTAALIGYNVWYLQHHGILRRGDLRPRLASAGTLLAQAWPLALSQAAVLLIYNCGAILLGFTHGDDEVGLYTTAYKLMFISTVLSGSMMSAFFPVLAQVAGDPAQARRVSGEFATLMVWMGLPIAALGFACGRHVNDLLFGAQFAASGPYFEWMCLAIGFTFLNIGLGTPLLAWGHQTLHLKILALAATVSLALNAFLVPRYGGWGAVAAFLASEALAVSLLAFARQRLVEFGRHPLLSMLAAPVLCCAAVVFAIEMLPPSAGRYWWLQVGVGAAVLGGCMLLFERRIAKAAWRLVRRLR
ncbi:MAG: flippase [Reyranella sp.]|nr:flippase [Reyranella sp.]MBL6653288.1 flippase [Reyranella sp.]